MRSGKLWAARVAAVLAACMLLGAGSAWGGTGPRLEDLMGECSESDLDFCDFQPRFCSTSFVLCEDGTGYARGENVDLSIFSDYDSWPQAHQEAVLDPCHACNESSNLMMEYQGYTNYSCHELDISVDYVFKSSMSNPMAAGTQGSGLGLPDTLYSDSMHILMDYGGCLQVEYDVDNRAKVTSAQIQGAWVNDFSYRVFLLESTYAMEHQGNGNWDYYTETNPDMVTVDFPQYRAPALHYNCTVFGGGVLYEGAFPEFDYTTWNGIPSGWRVYHSLPRTWPRFPGYEDAHAGSHACDDVLGLVNHPGAALSSEFGLAPEDVARDAGMFWQGTASFIFRAR